MPLIELQNISKIYNAGENEVRALDDVSLTVQEGDFVAIVGQSGSGKSTLMNILGCLDTPTHGRYRLRGRDVSSLSEAQLSTIRNRDIGFVFQSFYLLPGLTALENVELPLIYRGIKPSKRRELARESLCRVGLSDRMQHRPSEMSGGQQQRVAIARAIAGQPSLLLADEPTGNLDSHAGQNIMAILREWGAQGRTVVLITHDPTLAETAPRIVQVCDGRVLCG